jgi:diamine N-acetyltransferase
MIAIRMARVTDIPHIRSIAREAWPVAFGDILSPTQIDYMLEMMYSESSLALQMKNGHQFILADIDDKACGYLSYEQSYKGSTKTKIHKFYILPNLKSQGIGKALIDNAEHVARQNRATHLTLNVNRYNKAVQYYIRQGYSVVGQEDIDIGSGFLMEDFIMEKSLTLGDI